MSDVIAESGPSAGAIYGYFSGKDEIVVAVAREIIGGRSGEIEALASADPVPPLPELVRVILRGIPDGALEGGAVVQMWGAAGSRPEMRGIAVDVLGGLQDGIESYLRRLYAQEGREDPESDARAAAPLVVALAQGYIVRSALIARADVDAFARGVEALLGPRPA